MVMMMRMRGRRMDLPCCQPRGESSSRASHGEAAPCEEETHNNLKNT